MNLGQFGLELGLMSCDTMCNIWVANLLSLWSIWEHVVYPVGESGNMVIFAVYVVMLLCILQFCNVDFYI